VVANVESRHLLRSTGGVVVAAGTLYEQLAQLVPVSFGGGDVAVGDWTDVVKSACGPWISQKCPSDISVSAMEVDDQHDGQRASARGIGCGADPHPTLSQRPVCNLLPIPTARLW
jgi:hypothetical protein